MINVIIMEGLYDRDFVNERTVGFDKLKKFIENHPPEKMAEITWVPAETIKAIGRLYAQNKPGCIITGNGTENNINNYQFGRAAAILRAITGNLGVPGGEIEISMPPLLQAGAMEIHRYDLISSELRNRRIGAEEGVLPDFFSALPQKLVKAMITSEPYPLVAAFIHGGNFLNTQSNVKEIYQALKSLDFLVVSDLFMTPTAEMADIVLPVATYLEIDDIVSNGNIPGVSVTRKVTQVGECWSAYKIFNELGIKLKLKDFFWENDKQVLDFILKPTGLTFDELSTIGLLYGNKIYRDYINKGFRTPSGKVELYSKQLEEWGFDPLPVFREPPESPISDVELFKEYPLVLTNRKVSSFIHSSGRQIKSLRDNHPDPIVILKCPSRNPE